MNLHPACTVLFTGDSITDAGRNRDAAAPNDAAALGRGYALMAAATLLHQHAGLGLWIYNRGISGNKVTDLAERWQRDTLALQPDLVSILIGVNDTWHSFKDARAGVSIADYESTYDRLLGDLHRVRPACRLVLCEPFVLKTESVLAVADRWFPEIDHRREVVRRLAQRHGAVLVDFQRCFDVAVGEAAPAYWSGDGVHPSVAGHMLMARHWLHCTGLA